MLAARHMARTSTTKVEALPWWATPGDEVCAHCLQRYHYHLEVRCTECDEPMCPSCAVRLTVDVVTHHCPECVTGDCEEA